MTQPTTEPETVVIGAPNVTTPAITAGIVAMDKVTVHTTGEAGQTVDFNTMKSHAPYVFIFVLGLAFLLLLVAFRSIVMR